MEIPNTDLTAITKTVATRLSLVFVFSFVVIAILAVMFVVLNARIRNVEVGARNVEVGARAANIERVLMRDKNYRWAIEQYKQLALNSRSAIIEARLGTLYFYLPIPDKAAALEHLEMAKKIDPSYPETYANLGNGGVRSCWDNVASSEKWSRA
jgi:tetratricopeptide (TPR) repeat protein